MFWNRMFAWGLVALLCAGCGGGSSSSAKKKSTGKKKSSGSAAADKAVEDLRDWLGEGDNASRWGDFTERADAVRKKISKDKKAVEKLDELVKNVRTNLREVLVMKADGIPATAKLNEGLWEKYLEQLDDVLKEMDAFDPELAKENTEKIAGYRLEIIKKPFEEGVTKFAAANRTESEKVFAACTEWRKRLEPLGDAAKDMLAEIDGIEQSTKEIEGWMQRTPPGAVDLLAPEHRAAWKTFGSASLKWEGDELVLTGTGTDKKDSGTILHQAFWWTDFEIDVVFQIEAKGFSVIGRGHPPASGWSQNCPERVFEGGKPWHLTINIQGEEAEVSGDIAPTKKSAKGTPGGGIGLFVGPEAKVRILKLEVRPPGAAGTPYTPSKDPEEDPGDSGGEDD